MTEGEKGEDDGGEKARMTEGEKADTALARRQLEVPGDEGFGAFVVPVGSQRRMEAPDDTAWGTRRLFGIVPYRPGGFGVLR